MTAQGVELESIQVEGGTQQDFKKQQNATDDASFTKIRLIITWGIGLILLLAVLIYAGIRGNATYNMQPSYQVSFQPRSVVKFPAVTVCGMEPWVWDFGVIQCAKITLGQFTGDCTQNTYTQFFQIEGNQYKCITFNDPLNSGGSVMLAANVADSLNLILFMNSSGVQVGEGIGVAVMLHDQSSAPNFEQESTFISTIGQISEVIIDLNEIHTLDGSIYNNWTSSSYNAFLREDSNLDYQNLVSMTIFYANQGVYINQQYLVYTTNNWLGEVGGIACLLWFLHWLVTGILLLLVARVKGHKYSFSSR